MTEQIPVDEQAILALEKSVTGAWIHDARILIHRYRDACARGDTEAVERIKRSMTAYAMLYDEFKNHTK